MPSKGVNVCGKCKRWGCKATINDKNQVIATCPHCGHSWKSRSRFERRILKSKVEATIEGQS